MEAFDLWKFVKEMGINCPSDEISIIEATQKRWLRPDDLERWHLQDLSEKDKQKVLKAAQRLGFINAMKPKFFQYKYCLIHGGPITAMQNRLSYMVEQWKEGIRFDEVVLLTGMRPLDPLIEEVSNSVATETDEMLVLWKTLTFIPQEIKTLPLTLISSRMKKAEGKLKRPTTADTLVDWMKMKPQIGSCLLISTQPFCQYQHEVAVSCIKPPFSIETIGSSPEESDYCGSVILDTMARWFYQKHLNNRVS